MAAFLARRISQGFIVVALVATIVFLLIHAAPGDPFATSLEDPRITESVRENWRRAYGLDRPLSEQYVRYVTNVFRGELGFSFSLKRPVADALGDAIPNTLLLMTMGLLGGFALGIATAIAQVRRRGKPGDRILGSVSLTFLSVPDFWLALLMVVVFALWLDIFPSGGATDAVMYDGLGARGKLLDRLHHLVLPALTLTLLYFPIIARHQRAALLDVMPSEYITTARAKGVAESRVITRHALRNALLPIITLVGVAFPALLTGAVFIEKVFSWPGMGSLIVNSIGSRDYPLLIAAVMMGSALVVAGSIWRTSSIASSIRAFAMSSDTPLMGMPLVRATREWAGRDRSGAIAAALLLAIAIPCLLASVIAPHDPIVQPGIIEFQNRPPSLLHPFGTDPYSRDVLSRLMYGGRLSLTVAIFATLVSVTLGTAYGAVAGYASGLTSAILERILDALLSIPRLLLLIAILAAWNPLPLRGFIVILGLTGWYAVARLVRGQVLALKHQDFVLSARALGATRSRIFMRHILPNVVTPVIVAATLGVGHVIVLEAGLSWLGIGVQIPHASWGNMIQDGAGQIKTLWWISLFPGLAIVVTVMAFNVLGDALLRALSPRQSVIR